MSRLRQHSAMLVAGLCAALTGSAFAERPVAGSLAADRLKLPSGPGSVRGLADEPDVDPFAARLGVAVPIDVPAGYGKLAPALALTYSGALGNGPLGIGWTMPGARIERSLRLGVPAFDDTDELELSGPVSGRLVAIAADEYRVEGLGQTVRVRRVGAAFEVDLGDGSRMRFGATAASRQESGARTQAWLVDQHTNLAGEQVGYEYQQDQGQIYLSRVAWGPAQRYAVELAYVARPDPTTSYREGFRVVTARRLDQIRVVAEATTRRTYQLHYDNSFSVTRLARVSSTGRAGAGAWPDLTLDYATAATPAVQPLPGVGTWRLNASGTTLVDLDADGASDLLQLADGGHSYRINQNGSFGPRLPLAGNTQSITVLQLQDIDGDARADLLQDTGSGWTVWKWTRTQWLQQPGGVWPGSAGLALKNPATTRFADLDGDGLIDAIQWDNDGLKIRDATRTGFLAPRQVARIGGTQVPTATGRFQDANGDGLDDYLVVADNRLDVYIGRGDGTFDPVVARAYPFPELVTNPDDLHLVDLDRDDLLDLVRVDLGTVRWFRGRADGGFTATAITVPNPEPLSADVVVTVGDVNGNGSHDLVWSSATNMWVMDVVGPTTAGMLVATHNGLGLDAQFQYRSAHALSVEARLANDPWQYEVPIAMPVPVRKVTALGPGETTRQIDYLVRDGFWDAAERRFGGFLNTIVTTWGATPAQTSSVQRRYHNGTGANRNLRGSVLVEQVRDGTGRRLSITTNTWDTVAVAGLPDVPLLRRAALRDTRVRFEESVPLRETRESHEYDALGRVRRTTIHGRLDLDHDDSVHEVRYADDDATWVRDLVCEDKLLTTAGAIASHSQQLYGDEVAIQPLCVAGKGWPRETRSWLASENRWVTTAAATYDAHGNALSATSAGVTRLIGYDAAGLFPISERVVTAPGVTQEWTMAWDGVIGQPIAMTEPNGHVTRASYDSLGRFTALALDARPPHQHVQYDWTAPFPKTTVFEFDGAVADLGALPAVWTATAGWRQRVEITNGAGEVRYRALRRAPSEWIISNYTERDPASRVVFEGQPVYSAQLELVARPAGMTGNQRLYDPLGRLVEQRLPTGARRTYTYAAFERTMQEDTLAPVHSVLDGLGRAILTERSLADGTHELVEARYDAAGRLTTMTLAGGEVVRGFSYDTLGRLIATSDPDLGARRLAWDDGGRLIRELNGAGQIVRYGYDLAGRLVEREVDPGALYRYHYDTARPGAGAGPALLQSRLAWIEEPTGTIDLGYDEVGQTTFRRRVIDGRTAEQTTTYAPSGLVRTIAHDDGVTLAYTYDPAGRANGIANVWQLLDQDASGRPLAEQFENGVLAQYSRDALGLVAGVLVQTPDGQVPYHVALTRTGWAAIDHVTDLDGVGLDHTTSFAYDGFARLIGAQVGTAKHGFTFGYAYDHLHNMTSRTAVGPKLLDIFTGAHRYGEGGAGPRQLTSVSDPSGAHTFTYDAAGRQITRDGATMTFDALDRLTGVDGLPGALTHSYGSDDARVKTTAPDGSIAYWFDAGTAERGGQREHDVAIGERVIARVTLAPSAAQSARVADPASAAIGLALAALCVALPLARRRRRRRGLAAIGAVLLVVACSTPSLVEQRSALWGTPQWVYLHAGIGAGPTLFTDESGQVLEERRYEAFGAPIDARVLVGGTYITGDPDLVARDRNVLNKRTEAVTGWSDHGARWMASETGRWLTPDPPVKGPAPELMDEPWNLHPYQYVAQNPVAYWDPDGHDLAHVEVWQGSRATKTVGAHDVNVPPGVTNVDVTHRQVQLKQTQNYYGVMTIRHFRIYVLRGSAEFNHGEFIAVTRNQYTVKDVWQWTDKNDRLVAIHSELVTDSEEVVEPTFKIHERFPNTLVFGIKVTGGSWGEDWSDRYDSSAGIGSVIKEFPISGNISAATGTTHTISRTINSTANLETGSVVVGHTVQESQWLKDTTPRPNISSIAPESGL